MAENADQLLQRPTTRASKKASRVVSKNRHRTVCFPKIASSRSTPPRLTTGLNIKKVNSDLSANIDVKDRVKKELIAE